MGYDEISSLLQYLKNLHLKVPWCKGCNANGTLVVFTCRKKVTFQENRKHQSKYNQNDCIIVSEESLPIYRWFRKSIK